MSPRDEESVERYVRFPETLSEAERARIADLLRDDPVARRLAAFYRGFYDELERVANEGEVDEVDTGADHRASRAGAGDVGGAAPHLARRRRAAGRNGRGPAP